MFSSTTVRPDMEVYYPPRPLGKDKYPPHPLGTPLKGNFATNGLEPLSAVEAVERSWVAKSAVRPFDMLRERDLYVENEITQGTSDILVA